MIEDLDLTKIETQSRLTQVVIGIIFVYRILKLLKSRKKKRVKLTLIQGGKMDPKPMESAYDFKVLGQMLKQAGLDGAEETVAKAYPIIKLWLKESAKISKPMADDVAMSFIDQLDPILLPQIDKINGKIGA